MTTSTTSPGEFSDMVHLPTMFRIVENIFSLIRDVIGLIWIGSDETLDLCSKVLTKS